MVKRLIYLFLVLCISSSVEAQLLPLLDQYHVNGLAINPAYAGSHDALSIELSTRYQWVGFEGAPRTLTLSIHSPLRNKKVNLGIILLSDRYGSNQETGFLLNYAYRIPLGQGSFSLGLAAGVSSLSTDMDAFRVLQTGDMLLQDPARRAFIPEFSFGGYYQSDWYFIGLSMPLFLSHPVNESNGRYELAFNLSKTNYMLAGGYLFILSENFELQPSFLLRSNPSNNTQLDLNATIIYREKIWLGTTFRTNGNLTTILQMQATRQLRLGYSYGYEISELSNYQHGSHEAIIIYRFKYLLEVASPRIY